MEETKVEEGKEEVTFPSFPSGQKEKGKGEGEELQGTSQQQPRLFGMSGGSYEYKLLPPSSTHAASPPPSATRLCVLYHVQNSTHPFPPPPPPPSLAKESHAYSMSGKEDEDETRLEEVR